jgi:hypothetical protein
MTPDALVAEILRLGVRLEDGGDRLRVRPLSALPPSLKSALATGWQDVLRVLRDQQPVQPPRVVPAPRQGDHPPSNDPLGPLEHLARGSRADSGSAASELSIEERASALRRQVRPPSLLPGEVRLFPAVRPGQPTAGACWSCGTHLGASSPGHTCRLCRHAFDLAGVQPVLLVAPIPDDPSGTVPARTDAADITPDETEVPRDF